MAAIDLWDHHVNIQYKHSRFPNLLFTRLRDAINLNEVTFLQEQLVPEGKIVGNHGEIWYLVGQLKSAEMMQVIFDYKAKPEALAPFLFAFWYVAPFQALIDLVDPDTKNLQGDGCMVLIEHPNFAKFGLAYLAAGGNRYHAFDNFQSQCIGFLPTPLWQTSKKVVQWKLDQQQYAFVLRAILVWCDSMLDQQYICA